MNRILSKQWTRQSLAAQPPARKGGSMAYDVAHQNTLLFGGGGLNDTWLWDGNSWLEQHPSASPPARTSACMAYDALHASILLFGGVNTSGLPLNDTWLWDGQTWLQQQPLLAPPARCGAVMAYSIAQQTLLLFGGEAMSGRTGLLLNDTWLWNGTQWQQLSNLTAPEGRIGAALAYDSARQTLLLFGGTAGSTVYADTWLWNEQGWQKLLPTHSPSARAWSSMVYDLSAQQIVLVGGSQPTVGSESPTLSDTWTWNGSNWSQLSNLQAPAGGYHSAAYDSTHQLLILYAGPNSKAALVDKQGKTPNLIAPPPTPEGETWLWHSL